jgi:hypothetical protein
MMSAGRDAEAGPSRDPFPMEQTIDPAAGKVMATRRVEAIRVHAWRSEQLQRLGISRLVAQLFAERVDWHQVEDLVGRGCPPFLALDIAR